MSGLGLLMLFVSTALTQTESVIVKRYGKKHKIGGMFFNAIICVFAAVFFIVKELLVEGRLEIPMQLLPYAFFSCLMYATGFYTMYLSLQFGSFGLTKLVTSFSGIISIGYGVIFLEERPHLLTYIAIVLVFASVFLMRFENGVKESNTGSKTFSAKWLICVILCVVSNGFIAVLSKAQQNVFFGECDGEFKALSYIGAFIALTVLGFVLEKDNLRYIIKHGTVYGIFAGLVNGGHNFVHLIIYSIADLSVSTPMLTGFGLIASFALSLLLYKEKFTKMQVVAVCVGFVAFILFQVASAISA